MQFSYRCLWTLIVLALLTPSLSHWFRHIINKQHNFKSGFCLIPFRFEYLSTKYDLYTSLLRDYDFVEYIGGICEYFWNKNNEYWFEYIRGIRTCWSPIKTNIIREYSRRIREYLVFVETLDYICINIRVQRFQAVTNLTVVIAKNMSWLPCHLQSNYPDFVCESSFGIYLQVTFWYLKNNILKII